VHHTSKKPVSAASVTPPNPRRTDASIHKEKTIPGFKYIQPTIKK
jgi:hypothetical protein